MFYSIGYFILVESGIAFYHIFPYIIELTLLYSTGKTVSDFFFLTLSRSWNFLLCCFAQLDMAVERLAFTRERDTNGMY